jgi:hypothetical protein
LKKENSKVESDLSKANNYIESIPAIYNHFYLSKGLYLYYEFNELIKIYNKYLIQINTIFADLRTLLENLRRKSSSQELDEINECIDSINNFSRELDYTKFLFENLNRGVPKKSDIIYKNFSLLTTSYFILSLLIKFGVIPPTFDTPWPYLVLWLFFEFLSKD